MRRRAVRDELCPSSQHPSFDAPYFSLDQIFMQQGRSSISPLRAAHLCRLDLHHPHAAHRSRRISPKPIPRPPIIARTSSSTPTGASSARTSPARRNHRLRRFLLDAPQASPTPGITSTARTAALITAASAGIAPTTSFPPTTPAAISF